MRSLSSRRWARRHGDERGVALLELALALPFLVLFLMGLVEGGMAWQAVTQVNSATRAAGRVASHDGKQSSADYDAVTAINAALPVDLRDQIVRVVIYKSTASDDTVPSSCLTNAALSNGGVSGVCNVYTATKIKSAVINNFGTSSSCAGKWDAMWCPRTRNVDGQSTYPGNIDYMGVYIETVHKNVTHSLFKDYKIKRRVVFRLEPEL